MFTEPDWDLVKKITLWSYENLVDKLLDVLAYRFVQEHYDFTMPDAREYNKRIRHGYLQDRGDMLPYIDRISGYLAELEARQIATTADLVNRVATRQQCIAFLGQTGFDFESLIQTLNYLLRWVLPFKAPLREFIDVEQDSEVNLLNALKKQKIGSNLDLLEAGRFAAGRMMLAKVCEIPLAFITVLVHKADISRLAYVRGKTVRHLCGGGYDTLERLASANLPEMEMNKDAYYRTLGKSFSDFKSVIPLGWMIGGAQIIPRVVSA